MFVPGRDFQASLMFAYKAKRLPQRGVNYRCSTLVCYRHISSFSSQRTNGPYKLVFHYTRLERLARDKYSSLLGTFDRYITFAVKDINKPLGYNILY